MEDHYTVLGLSHRQHDPHLNAQDVRKAYRQALLKHHPDKVDSGQNEHGMVGMAARGARGDAKYTIDQITTASSVLSDATLRAEYDRLLRQQGRDTDAVKFFTGLDTVDLDDLDDDETQGIWFRGCRCGDDRGFIVSEDDLEAATGGELVVGCKGCSLWLKVLFSVAIDDPADDAEDK
ncbi:CSL zinc finger-domain-containing protein [Elsinoe ampelina]|uniref:Diphthamide biosynthesis protein 4 n=1 Tax=Elsinoe ampelina TaxID=302913 RepID=A0A6A6G8S7_9PEZI|nr:CSL zinc finger-domain-containing protein [Elsinoe ampelina]